MEKLQAAMERARLARSQATPAKQEGPQAPSEQPQEPPVPAAAAAPPPKADAAAPQPTAEPEPSNRDQLWQALPPLHISDRQLIKQRVVTREAGSKATPFDILRTKALLQMRQNGWKRIAITSPMPQAGKTTNACNMALGFGRQRDLRTILFDFDLRDPSVHKFFNATPPRGIGDVLTGRADFSENALRVGSNVAVSMALDNERDPTRLLLSEDTIDVLADVEARYDPDVMIFDLPSVLVNDDTRAFLKNVDCALIVIRAHKTAYGQFDVCEREIAEQTNVLGVVLNAHRYG